MKRSLSFKLRLMLFTVLSMLSIATNADIIEYTISDECSSTFHYKLNTKKKKAELARYMGKSTEVIIPESITYQNKVYRVTSLRDSCFIYSDSIKTIEIPSSVTCLGEWCFSFCWFLKSMTCKISILQSCLLFQLMKEKSV